MSRKSRGLKVLSLALLAVAGLMAFLAAGAQASEKSWLVLGADIGANQEVEVSTHKEIILDVAEENELEILCLNVAGDDVLLVAGTTTVTGTLLFTNCKIFQKKEEKAACNKKVNGLGKVEGLLEPIVASGKGKLILHPEKGKNYVLFEPTVAGGNFAQIKFDPPCALPETNNVKGSLVAECLTSALVAADCATQEIIHLLQANQTSLFEGDKLFYGTKAAILLGVAKTELSSKEPWCGHV
jgi:hypothetical protein